MSNGNIITRDLNRNFEAAMRGAPLDPREFAADADSLARGYAAGRASAKLAKGSGYASSGV